MPQLAPKRFDFAYFMRNEGRHMYYLWSDVSSLRVGTPSGGIRENRTSILEASERPTFFSRSVERTHLLDRGKKSIHHHRGTPPFSVCCPTPRSQSKKSYGVYYFYGKTREKGIHHRSGKKVYTIEPQTPKKKKRRVSTVVVYTFFFLAWRPLKKKSRLQEVW